MEHRHGRIGREYYSCPTAQARTSPHHRDRRLGSHAHGLHLTNGKRPHWSASAAGFRTNTDGCCGHCNSPSRANAVAASRMPHRRHAKNFARKLLSLPLDTTPTRSDAPAYRPVCGKHCSCRVSVVTHGFNSSGVARSLALWKVNFPSEPE
ncbi:hypothetical protein Tc00.1047053506595.21 [Trypanosoma cruzi]|uniref:Uncharacterized protein n=1 Tax=Trypanosoma cruzi (strain CL Brener) TaxID=353153 RepID=Q4DLC6_TRYCC|nr:hypothetical protein Tc00.1047053506595.21 [Trypanosoma cruzi]EAN93328.1 hypothetical protein Tc00.1047053506595.21 [Trypanosoma cruzi]|eukprot:XP_815179.1 hypothetical protein [Trypanosoma cruzi strain CL Brener]